MRRIIATVFCFMLSFVSLETAMGQAPADGENSYRMVAVNPRFLPEPDTIDCSSGRGVYVAADPDLDGDGLPEVLVTEYSDGGRILVFEVIGNNKMEYVWGSKRINPGGAGGGSTPRSVSTGDWDNDGNMEIHFQIGYSASDSLSRLQRGLYVYEFTGTDNDYGSEPALHMPFEEIDPEYAAISAGRSENGLTCEDVDGDGKNELLFTTVGFGNLETGNMYILEVESGTFENGDASIRTEYKYDAMGKAIDNGDDGYIPLNTAVGDIDNDGKNEIVVIGWTNANSGGGVGFLEVTDVDTYTPGSVLPLSESSIFVVKGTVEIVDVDGSKVVLIGGMDAGSVDRKIWAIENIVSESFVSTGDIQVLIDGVAAWGIMAVGDQDHGSGSDGFDIYLSTSKEIRNFEYNGSGSLADPANYTNYGRIGQFNLLDAYDVNDGLFNSIYTYPGMDIDNDGNRDIVVGYKGACGEGGDMLEGELFVENSYGIFVFEWGDSTQSVPLTLTTDVKDRKSGFTIITPEDYQLEQNYPNPFNPTTNIRFSLPLEKTISLKIYNSLGQEIKTLINSTTYAEGSHTVQWDATDNSGKMVASGLYIYKLEFGNFSKSKTMTLVR